MLLLFVILILLFGLVSSSNSFSCIEEMDDHGEPERRFVSWIIRAISVVSVIRGIRLIRVMNVNPMRIGYNKKLEI